MDYDSPPTGNPEHFRQTSKILFDSPMPRQEAIEKSETKSRVKKGVAYGIRLDFIQENEDNLQLTDDGSELYYSWNSPERARIFQDAIYGYELYRELLRVLRQDKEDEVIDGGYILAEDVANELKSSFGLNRSDDRLSKYASTFLKTLDSADLGDYIKGSGPGKGTRLETTDNFLEHVDQLLNDSVPQEEPTEKTDANKEFGTGEYQFDGHRPDTDETRAANPKPNPDIGASLNIELSLSGTDDPQRVYEIIQAVKKALGAERGAAISIDETGEDGQSETQEIDSTNEETNASSAKEGTTNEATRDAKSCDEMSESDDQTGGSSTSLGAFSTDSRGG
jgi:hypothetical protein